MTEKKFSSWLDQTVAWPFFGLKFKQQYRHVFDYRKIVLKTVTEDMGVGVNHLYSQPNAYEFSIDSRDGFVFTVNQERIVVRYQYTFEEKAVPGQLPRMEQQRVRPYSSLLDETLTKAAQLVQAISSIHEIEAGWVGIVASSILDKAKLPGGISNYVQSLGAPWGKNPSEAETRITIKLNDDDANIDRCHHTVKFHEEPNPDVFQLVLDWQRVPKKGLVLKSASISDILKNWGEDGVKYFAKFGQGSLK